MTLISFIIVLGVLVFVHELGHFAVARAVGVRVEAFSIGFGPQLIAKTVGDTTYKISLIPLGGFVKMFGEQPDDSDAEAPDAFMSQAVHKRAAIVLAGPAMNILFAYLAAPLMYLIGVPEPAHLEGPPVVGWIAEQEIVDHPTIKAGIHIVAVDDKDVADWRSLQTALALAEGETKLRVFDGGTHKDVELEVPNAGDLLSAVVPPMPPVVGEVVAGSASDTKIEAGDSIVQINGVDIHHWFAIRKEVDASKGEPLSVIVNRDGKEVLLDIQPKHDKDNDRYLMGVVMQTDDELHSYSLGESFKKGAERVNSMISLTFDVLIGLFSGDIGMKALGGPISIAQGAGQAASAGIGALIAFMVFISIQLGILNLLPIPILDGGHLTIMLIESVTRRRIPEKWIGGAQWTGFILLILLMIFVTGNDIVRIWGDKLSKLFGGS